jgi:hypothetical protein
VVRIIGGDVDATKRSWHGRKELTCQYTFCTRLHADMSTYLLHSTPLHSLYCNKEGAQNFQLTHVIALTKGADMLDIDAKQSMWCCMCKQSTWCCLRKELTCCTFCQGRLSCSEQQPYATDRVVRVPATIFPKTRWVFGGPTWRTGVLAKVACCRSCRCIRRPYLLSVFVSQRRTRKREMELTFEFV